MANNQIPNPILRLFQHSEEPTTPLPGWCLLYAKDDGNLYKKLAGKDEERVDGAFTFRELSSDPEDPNEGKAIMWMSDGTGSGDDGDIIMKITAGGVTKTTTLVDFSTI